MHLVMMSAFRPLASVVFDLRLTLASLALAAALAVPRVCVLA